MKTLLKTFATLLLVSDALGSLIMVGVNLDWASKVEAMRSNFLSRIVVEAARTDIPEASAFNNAAYMWIILIPASIVGIVAVFSKNHKFGWITGAGLLLLLALATVLQPSLSQIDGNDPQATAMGITFFGAIGSAVLIALHTFWKDIGKERFVPSTLPIL